jgi:myosin heavy subunit
MNRFAELLASTTVKPATVVHLGAGSCKEYDLYTSLNANRIIFVEPDQRLATQANDKFKTSSHVTVIERAVAVEKGRQLLNIISNPRFSSLLPPAELLDFYPNITITDKTEIETVTLEQLCDLHNIDDQTNNLMVAELQGIEKELFPSATKTILHKFKWIVIRSSEHRLYKPVSDRPQKDLKQAMQDAGYFVLVLKEDASPHTNIFCIRNEDQIANALLKQQEHDLNKSIEVLERKMFEDKADLEKQKSTYRKQLEETEVSLQSKSDELTQSIVQAQSLIVEKEKLSQDLLEQTRKATELASKITQLESEATHLVTEIAGLKQVIAGLKENITEKAKELAEMQQTLRINNKLMLKSDADLSDLQNQYRTAIQHQEQQHSLLCELKEKLSQAAGFYRKLNLQNLVIDGDKLDQSDSDNAESISTDDTED